VSVTNVTGEAEFWWTSGSSLVSDDKNDVVMLKNHPPRPDGDGEDDKCDEKDELDDLLGLKQASKQSRKKQVTLY
jgi:hypothetical protein